MFSKFLDFVNSSDTLFFFFKDYIWLEHINGERKPDHLSQVSKEMFETLMDRFEKECYFESQSGRHTSITPKDEDANLFHLS